MRNMPPWDAIAWFDTPVETTKGLPIGVLNQVCDANPMRVGLILGVPGSNSSNVTFSINPITSPTGGYVVNGNIGALILTHADWGPLVQQAWFAVASGAGQQATVTELRLHDWPQPDPDDTGDVRDYIAHLGDLIKALSAKIDRKGVPSNVRNQEANIFGR